MPYDWVDPPIFLTHNDVVVYHIHKNDHFQDGIREYWFALQACEALDEGEHTFDVRELPTWKPRLGDSKERAIKDAIDSGYFDAWEKDEPHA